MGRSAGEGAAAGRSQEQSGGWTRESETASRQTSKSSERQDKRQRLIVHREYAICIIEVGSDMWVKELRPFTEDPATFPTRRQNNKQMA
jgi:hypothetical protein